MTAVAAAVDDLSSLPWDAINGTGVVGICVLIVVAYTRRWVVPGVTHRETQNERDEWRDIALRSLSVTERTTDATEVTAQALAALPTAVERRAP